MRSLKFLSMYRRSVNFIAVAVQYHSFDLIIKVFFCQVAFYRDYGENRFSDLHFRNSAWLLCNYIVQIHYVLLSSAIAWRYSPASTAHRGISPVNRQSVICITFMASGFTSFPSRNSYARYPMQSTFANCSESVRMLTGLLPTIQ